MAEIIFDNIVGENILDTSKGARASAKAILKAMEGETKLDPEIEKEFDDFYWEQGRYENREYSCEGIIEKLATAPEKEMYFKVDGEISKLLLEFANTRIKERGNGRNWLLKLRKKLQEKE